MPKKIDPSEYGFPKRAKKKPSKNHVRPVSAAVEALDAQDPQIMMFVSEYLKDFDAIRAATKCGMFEPISTGPGMLRRWAVRQMLDAEIIPIIEKNFVTVRSVITELAKVAFSNIEDFGYIDESSGHFVLDLRNVPRHKMAAISKVKTECDEVSARRSNPRGKRGVPEDDEETVTIKRRMEICQHDKTRALELLGKYLKMFGDLVPDGPGTNGAPPVLNIKFVSAGKK